MEHEQPAFERGMKVRYSGYDGTVERVCDGQLTGMLEVALPGGVVCVGASDVTPPTDIAQHWHAVRSHSEKGLGFDFPVESRYGKGTALAVREDSAIVEMDIVFDGKDYHVIGFPSRDENGVWRQRDPHFHHEQNFFVYEKSDAPGAYQLDGLGAPLRGRITKAVGHEVQQQIEARLPLFYDASIHESKQQMERGWGGGNGDFYRNKIAILEAKRECALRGDLEGIKHAEDRYFEAQAQGLAL